MVIKAQDHIEPPGRSLALEQDRRLNYGLRSTAVLNLVLGALLVTAHWSEVDSQVLVVWAQALTFALLLRMSLWWWGPDQGRLLNGLSWRLSYTLLTGLTAVVWGGGAWVLFAPDSPELQALLALALVGLGTGALIQNLSLWFIVWFYESCLMMPLILRFYQLESETSNYIALLLVLFLLAVMGFSRRLSAMFDAQVELQFKQEALTEAEHRQQIQFKRLIESTRAVLWEADPKDLGFTYISPEVEQLLGYPADEWARSPSFWADHVHREDRGAALEYRRAKTSRLEEHSVDYRMIAADGREVWVRDAVNVVVDDDQAVKIGGVMIDITELKETTENLKYVCGLQGLMVDFSRSLIRQSDGEPDQLLNEILERIGTWCRVDRAYFIRFNEDLMHFTNTHEWTAEGITPEMDSIVDVPSASMPRLVQRLKFHEDVVIPDVDMLSDDWHAERQILQPQGIKSLIVLPVFAGSQLIGMVGFDAVRELRKFVHEEVALLRVLGDLLGEAMARARANLNLREIEAQRRSAESLARMGVWHWNVADDTIRLSDESAQIVGMLSGQHLRSQVIGCVHKDDREGVEGKFKNAVQTRSALEFECRMTRPDNREMIWLKVHAESALDGESRVSFKGYLQDITNRKLAEVKLDQQAHYDRLTKLPNWILLTERLEQALKRVEGKGGRLSVLVLDLDHFKKVNESMGHDVGDQVLVDAARRLEKTVGERDTVARSGGDEFLLLLDDYERSDYPEQITNTIVEEFRRPFQADRRNLVLTASIGLATYPDDGIEARDLIRNADTAMYRAKTRGRDGFVAFDHSMVEAVSRQLRLEEALRGALSRGEIAVKYQPIIRLSDRLLTGLEALMRWHHPQLGDVSPTEFIPVAEQIGLIDSLYEFMVERVTADLSRWRSLSALALTVAMNVSPRQFRNQQFARDLIQTLHRAELPPSLIKIEITEGVLLSGIESVPEILRDLLEEGVGIAMDDFGTGYSSLSYLRDYPFTTVKIDQRFVRDVGTDPRALQLVESILGMCDALNIDVVAEGVETQEQLDALFGHGCGYGQGFRFSQAVSASRIDDWLGGAETNGQFTVVPGQLAREKQG